MNEQEANEASMEAKVLADQIDAFFAGQSYEPIASEIEIHPILRADSPLITEFTRRLLEGIFHIVECWQCGNDGWVQTNFVEAAKARNVWLVFLCEKCTK